MGRMDLEVIHLSIMFFRNKKQQKLNKDSYSIFEQHAKQMGWDKKPTNFEPRTNAGKLWLKRKV